MRCWLCRFNRLEVAVGAAHVSDPDAPAMAPVVQRRAHGRHYDQLSRADRNRVRRVAHEHHCAWVLYRTEDKAARAARAGS
jgi:hypothetical protein